MNLKNQIGKIIIANYGYSLIEILFSIGLLSLGIIFILQASLMIINNSVKEEIRYLGFLVVQNKIEIYNSLCFMQIKEGKFQDEPYPFLKRLWEVKNYKGYYQICISSYSSGGYLLSNQCIKREKYD